MGPIDLDLIRVHMQMKIKTVVVVTSCWMVGTGREDYLSATVELETVRLY